MFRTLLPALVVLLTVGCVTPYQSGSRPVPVNTRTSKRAMLPLEPVTIAWSGDPRIAFHTALQGLVERGFEVTLSDSSAGVLKVERIRLDADATDDLEDYRRDVLSRISERQQARLLREGKDALFIKRYLHRRLSISVIARPDSVVITPRVERCVMPENECGDSSTFIESEIEDFFNTAFELQAAAVRQEIPGDYQAEPGALQEL